MEKIKREKYWTDNDDHEPLIFNDQDLLFPLDIVAKLNGLEKENARLREFKEKVNKELRIWNNEGCSEQAYMTALCNIEEIMLEGGEG